MAYAVRHPGADRAAGHPEYRGLPSAAGASHFPWPCKHLPRHLHSALCWCAASTPSALPPPLSAANATRCRPSCGKPTASLTTPGGTASPPCASSRTSRWPRATATTTWSAPWQQDSSQFRNLPMLIFWGELDFVFNGRFLAEWQRRFPAAEVHRFPEGGHYILEDMKHEVIPLVEDFLARTDATEKRRMNSSEIVNISRPLSQLARSQPDTPAIIFPQENRSLTLSPAGRRERSPCRRPARLGIGRGVAPLCWCPRALSCSLSPSPFSRREPCRCSSTRHRPRQ